MRLSLFPKIIIWYFLSVLSILTILLLFFNLQFRLDPSSPLRGQARDRITAVAWLVTWELGEAFRDRWDGILKSYSQAYGVTFLLASQQGEHLAGARRDIPPEVKGTILQRASTATQPEGAALPAHPPLYRRQPREQYGPPAQPPEAQFTVKASGPLPYWVGVEVAIPIKGGAPLSATLLAASETVTGHGLFLDPLPWMLILAIIVLLSIVLWIPLIRHLTTPLRRITAVTERVALGHFETRLPEDRQDELGRLSKAINDMALRLSLYIHGQKRFLGSIAHELASPLARINLGLALLDDQDEVVADVLDDVQQMSDLVQELLSFTKAELTPQRLRPEVVSLKAIAERVVDREAQGHPVAIDMEAELVALAQPDLVARALANLLRNALRYAGGQAIRVVGRREAQETLLEVRDGGPGVPEEAIPQLFEPFFRIEDARDRERGGVGLGLAIVRTCVSSCQGTVQARNIPEGGLAVTIRLPHPSSKPT